jgi:hypothetical protein
MAPPGPPSQRRGRVGVPSPTARAEHNQIAAERLALAELELAKVRLTCEFDGCDGNCKVAGAMRWSVESLRAGGTWVPPEAAA